MSEIDQQFLEYVVKSLVGKPDEVKIDRRIDEKGVLLELTVDPEDLGRVIGKRGATAQSLRTLLRALGTKNDARYNLKIIDNGTGGPSENNSAAAAAPAATAAAPAAPAADDTPVNTIDDEPVADTQPSQPEESSELPSESDTAKSEEDRDETSDRLQKTRDELADLDDLDV